MDGLQTSPLKAPAIEIVDLSSSQSSDYGEKCDDAADDASFRDGDRNDDDDHLSLYEDMLDGMIDGAECKDSM